MSIFQSSGDTGAYDASGGGTLTNPSNLPPIFDLRWEVADANAGTLVGGTQFDFSLLTAPEATWPGSGGGFFIDGFGTFGVNNGGGFTQAIQIPPYQSQVLNPTINSQPSASNRNAPDVSATAAGIFGVANGIQFNPVGTSFSSPIWAGMAALANEASANNGVKPVGNINQVLYDMAGVSQTFYQQVFNDMTIQQLGSTGFNTTIGYDLATGLGTPTCNLINQLASATPLVPIGTMLPPPQVAITMGIGYGCAIISGVVQCWGGNIQGQLGINSTTTQDSPVCVQGLPSSPAISVGAGTFQTCALLENGSVWCWGANSLGELGQGSTSFDSLVPRQVQLPPSFMAFSLGVGTHYACAVGMDGSVWCWGLNSLGQLGSATTTMCGATPCATTPQPTGVTGAIAVAAGGDAACALLAGGGVQCWGNNESGQIGNGTTSGPLPPTLVSGLSANNISAGDSYACAQLAMTGAVVCWGDNESGQFGNGTTNSSSMFQATDFLTLVPTAVTYLGAGLDHTCAILQPSILCAGDNHSGDLGSSDMASPEANPDGVQGLPGVPVAVATGGDGATCALLTNSLDAPVVACWGSDNGSQLGDGSTGDSIGTPVTLQLAHCP